MVAAHDHGLDLGPAQVDAGTSRSLVGLPVCHGTNVNQCALGSIDRDCIDPGVREALLAEFRAWKA
jgi:hypothetical protein